jgi:uncharacterized lipoprotein YmbA
MRPHLGFALAILFLLPFALDGCTNSPPTRFYVLSTMTGQAAAIPGKGTALGIGPVTLPEYLNRPQIVTRVSGNQLALAEFDQWGGDLNDNITRALAANLSNLLETDRVSLYPWQDGSPIDYQVTIDVVHFEQDVDGSSLLAVFWSVVDPRSGKVKLMQRSDYRDTGDAAQPGTTGDTDTSRSSETRPYDAIVAAMSRNLESLSRDIANAIIGLKGT